MSTCQKRTATRWTVLTLAVWTVAAVVCPAHAAEPAAYTPEEQHELDELLKTAQEFEQGAKEYRDAARHVVEQKYKEQRGALQGASEANIAELEASQLKLRT